MSRPVSFVLAGVLLSFVLSVSADEVTDQIESGLKAYNEQDYKGSLEELKFATVQIQEILNNQNTALLPQPFEGWIAEDVSNQTGAMIFAGGGTNMTREYKRDYEKVELQIMANSPMLNMMSMMINNPMMMASDPTTKPFRFKKLKGMKRTDGDEIEITLVMAGQVMIKAIGKRLQEPAVLEEYLGAIDFDRVRDAFL